MEVPGARHGIGIAIRCLDDLRRRLPALAGQPRRQEGVAPLDDIGKVRVETGIRREQASGCEDDTQMAPELRVKGWAHLSDREIST